MYTYTASSKHGSVLDIFLVHIAIFLLLLRSYMEHVFKIAALYLYAL